MNTCPDHPHPWLKNLAATGVFFAGVGLGALSTASTVFVLSFLWFFFGPNP